MKSLLFITSQLPYPPVKGGVIVSWNLIKNLSQHFRVSLINVLKEEDPQNEAEFLTKIELEDYFSYELNIGRSPATVLKSYAQGVPINFIRNFSPVLKEKIESVIDQYDYVLVDHYEMFQYIPDRVKGKTIMHEHNAEFVMWERYSELTSNPLKKLVTGMESKRIKAKEKAFCEKADLVLAYPNDKQILSEVTNGVGNFAEITPCGDDYMSEYPDPQWEGTEKSILYIGSLSWEANRDGLIWFIEEGWEKLKQRHPDTKFYIVGGNPDETIQALAAKHQDIILTGFVDDLEDYYPKCRVFVSPLRFGSGIKLKVINAMLRGIPVVTTPIGTEGMPVNNGQDLFSTETIEDFVDKTALLLEDQTVWEDIRDQSRVFAREHFSWAQMIERIKQVILSLDETVVSP